jgi:hypothetical protein
MMFLKLKHWQLCLLFIAGYLVSLVANLSFLLESAPFRSMLVQVGPFISVLSFASEQLWLYFIVVGLRSKISPELRPNLVAFYIALVIACIQEFCVVYLAWSRDREAYELYAKNVALAYAFMYLVALVIAYIAARTVVLVEQKGGKDKFIDVLPATLAFLFSLLGVWWIQPRINRIAAEGDEVFEPGGPIDR